MAPKKKQSRTKKRAPKRQGTPERAPKPHDGGANGAATHPPSRWMKLLVMALVIAVVVSAAVMAALATSPAAPANGTGTPAPATTTPDPAPPGPSPITPPSPTPSSGLDTGIYILIAVVVAVVVLSALGLFLRSHTGLFGKKGAPVDAAITEPLLPGDRAAPLVPAVSPEQADKDRTRADSREVEL